MVVDAARDASAIAAAATVRTSTAPNPWVGAVVVSGDGANVGTGATRPPGGPHADAPSRRPRPVTQRVARRS